MQKSIKKKNKDDPISYQYPSRAILPDIFLMCVYTCQPVISNGHSSRF